MEDERGEVKNARTIANSKGLVLNTESISTDLFLLFIHAPIKG